MIRYIKLRLLENYVFVSRDVFKPFRAFSIKANTELHVEHVKHGTQKVVIRDITK